MKLRYVPSLLTFSVILAACGNPFPNRPTPPPTEVRAGTELQTLRTGDLTRNAPANLLRLQAREGGRYRFQYRFSSGSSTVLEIIRTSNQVGEGCPNSEQLLRVTTDSGLVIEPLPGSRRFILKRKQNYNFEIVGDRACASTIQTDFIAWLGDDERADPAVARQCRLPTGQVITFDSAMQGYLPGRKLFTGVQYFCGEFFSGENTCSSSQLNSIREIETSGNCSAKKEQETRMSETVFNPSVGTGRIRCSANGSVTQELALTQCVDLIIDRQQL